MNLSVERNLLNKLRLLLKSSIRYQIRFKNALNEIIERSPRAPNMQRTGRGGGRGGEG